MNGDDAAEVVELLRTYARERLVEARRAVDDGDPLSARFMWGSIVSEEMRIVLDMLGSPAKD